MYARVLRVANPVPASLGFTLENAQDRRSLFSKGKGRANEKTLLGRSGAFSRHRVYPNDFVVQCSMAWMLLRVGNINTGLYKCWVMLQRSMKAWGWAVGDCWQLCK
jgi:hypothetical protein